MLQVQVFIQIRSTVSRFEIIPFPISILANSATQTRHFLFQPILIAQFLIVSFPIILLDYLLKIILNVLLFIRRLKTNLSNKNSQFASVLDHSSVDLIESNFSKCKEDSIKISKNLWSLSTNVPFLNLKNIYFLPKIRNVSFKNAIFRKIQIQNCFLFKHRVLHSFLIVFFQKFEIIQFISIPVHF